MHWPHIGIVVPSYNQATYLEAALESIRAQDYPQLSVAIMDGGSTDGSDEVVARWGEAPWVRYWQSQPDEGQAAAINAGVRQLGDCALVGWLNSDDYYCPDALWHVARAYLAHPDCSFYFGNGFREHVATGVRKPFRHSHLHFSRHALKMGIDYIQQPGTFVPLPAWSQVGGLREELHFGLDWDLFLRLAALGPPAVLNEFLAVSREHADTKTAGGGVRRGRELLSIIQEHAGEELTPGAVFYLVDTLLHIAQSQPDYGPMSTPLWGALHHIQHPLAIETGSGDGFPLTSDDDVVHYLPAATELTASRPQNGQPGLPSISLVIPSYNQGRYLARALQSIIDQRYPHLQVFVYDGGSTDESTEVIRQFEPHLTYWVSEPDAGPAAAINAGLKRATGELVGWLCADDVLAEDSLWVVARAFAANPTLGLVFGNALYIDEHDELAEADHGHYRTALYYGYVHAARAMHRFWEYVYSMPQPGSLFRRDVLESHGYLDESLTCVFDFELFWRLLRAGVPVQKLDRTLALYRLHTASKTTDWQPFCVELYALTRPAWRPLWTHNGRNTLRSYLKHFLPRWQAATGTRHRGLRWVGRAAWTALQATFRLGNPERAMLTSAPTAPPPLPPPLPTQDSIPPRTDYVIQRKRDPLRSLFCAFHWIRHPGLSGGETRDFHLLRRLLTFSRVEYFALYDLENDERHDPLHPYLDALYAPATLYEVSPELCYPLAETRPWRDEIQSEGGLVDPATHYHRDAAAHFDIFQTYTMGLLQRRLQDIEPDLLFVSPQCNPSALFPLANGAKTRFVLASYDVEAVRIERLCGRNSKWIRGRARHEIRRAQTFETSNVAQFDGVIAVSDLDRDRFQQVYGLSPERVVSLPNGVDTEYFPFMVRTPGDRPRIVFVAAMSYPPNHEAALRLVSRIMPRVRKALPTAQCWLVGQGPDSALQAWHDGDQTIVTGRVDDVRPYLNMSDAACLPLYTGSGTKLKLLEAMSAGVPAVCTPAATEGVMVRRGTDVLLGESDEELAAHLVDVCTNSDLQARLAEAGRYLVEREYAWDVTLCEFEAWIEQLRQLPPCRNRGGAGT